MAEINYNNLYDQLSPMDKMFYDQQFQKSSNSNNAVSASHSVNADTAVSSSHAINADNVVSASYALIAGGVNVLVQDVGITGSLEISGSLRGAIQSGISYVNNTASLDTDNYNFFEISIGTANNYITATSTDSEGLSQTINVKLTRGATYNPTAWDEAVFKFPGGIPFTGSDLPNSTDIVSFVGYGATFYGTAIENLG